MSSRTSGVIGRLRHRDDPNGFLMTYLQAGDAVLELFSFTAPKTSGPAPGPIASCELATQLVPSPHVALPTRNSARSPVEPVRSAVKLGLLPVPMKSW